VRQQTKHTPILLITGRDPEIFCSERKKKLKILQNNNLDQC